MKQTEDMKKIIKSIFHSVGLKVEKLDPDVEAIPKSFHASPFLPKVYLQTVGLVPYLAYMLDAVADVDGDVVECGVSIGHSLLICMLLEHVTGRRRRFFGFDSFQGFPENTQEDMTRWQAFTVAKGDYATPPSIVLRTLRDGRVPEELIAENLFLVTGFFDVTLPTYSSRIALLHLDCDLYESYKTCLHYLYHKVVPGGIILFDEYEDETFPGAKIAIDEFLADKPEKVQEYKRLGYHKYYIQKQ